ncbi:MAG: 3-hydroxyacyl-CoA dehydrogenase NAD-binding domain-containing protein, partial [Chromatiales bacterium]|nr:3-hydroxyacyl-CoA dehydrogenase NAD-binding domain-containing protein [Chromatiales bacterium]
MSALDKSKTVAVIGAGTMGAGVAQVAAAAGHTTLLFDTNAEAIERGIAGISKGLNRLVERGKMDEQQRDAILANLHPVTELEQLAPATLVIEAIIEDLATKQSLFRQLEDICGEETILATNTSSLSVTAIAAKLQRPGNLVGMHFFNPAPIMKLVEVVSGITTNKTVAEKVYDTSLAWGKHAVYAKSTPGFIVNRVARPFYAEGLRALEEGAADAATLDAIMRESGGFRMGPFELMDLIGHDVNYAVTCSVFDAYYNDPRFLPSLTQKELVDGGLLGRKSGRGFYNY